MWGYNYDGEFGNGTDQHSLVPLNADAPFITSATGANATTWQSFSYQLTTALNDASGYSATGLPAGLSLNAATGLLSGTPTGGGTSHIVLTAQNAAGTSLPVTLALTTRAEANLAYGATASALTSPSPGAPPSAAMDGDAATVWTSAASDPQWLTFDLGRTGVINSLVLTWRAGGIGAAYQLQVSSDGSTWTPVVTVGGNTSAGPLTYAGLNAAGRYVRLYGTARVNPSAGYSVGELAVYGNPSAAALPAVSGVRLHLRADAGVVASGTSVSQWSDQSGLGNDATEFDDSGATLVTNALNGLPVVHGIFRLPGSLLNGVTGAEIIAVIRAVTIPNYYRQGLWCFSDAGEADSSSNAYTDAFYPNTDGAIYETFGSNHQYGAGGANGVIRPTVPLDQFHLYDVAAGASGAWTARLDEATLFATTGNTPYFSAANGYTLGAARDTLQAFGGDFAEVFIFDHALSDADRLAVERYLATKYAVTSAPVSPSGLQARAFAATQVGLAWQAALNTGARQFVIERAAAGRSSYQQVGVADSVLGFVDNTAAAATAYAYRVVAVDLAGNWSAPSAPVLVTTPASSPAPPTAGLQLWLKADRGAPTSGSVATWSDQSGHGNNAQQPAAASQPTSVANVLNGLPVVHFAGNPQSMTLPNFLAGAGAGEMFVVHRATTPMYEFAGFHSFGTAQAASYPFYDGNIYDDFGSTTTWATSAPPRRTRATSTSTTRFRRRAAGAARSTGSRSTDWSSPPAAVPTWWRSPRGPRWE